MNQAIRYDANKVYNIQHWGSGYFFANPAGRIEVQPSSDRPARLNLTDLVSQLREAGVTLPVLVRFPDILQDRVNRLCAAFDRAIENHDYQGGYTAVYPIKVNQQRRVVEELLESQARVDARVGLEAGSKPELLAVLALAGTKPTTLVCNGYKDREYLRLALMGERLGHKVYIVVEKPSEAALALEEGRQLGIRPRLGVRARLSSIGKGHWQDSGGEKSKFGLAASQLLAMVEQLRQADALDCLQLLHFHLGSQIANIRDIQRGLKECGRFYQELLAQGAPVQVVDVGGGLGIDYDGTRSRNVCSINYSMAEYANNVVHALHQVCEANDLPHPHLISESGRALTAHHAVLITNIIDVEAPDLTPPAPPEEDAPLILHELWRVYGQAAEDIDERSLVETWHDVVQALSEAQDMYIHGLLDLPGRALAERIYTCCAARIHLQLNLSNRVHREIHDELNEKLADKLFVNFSLFQSLPDTWGIQQVFPVLPLSGLETPPTRRGVIQDITCDSDGRIDEYVDAQGLESTLPIPDWAEQDEKLLGFFLTGAYQEILGDLHNLFGDTDSVDVVLDDQGQAVLENLIKGDTVDRVLRYVNFDPDQLLASLKDQLAASNLDAAQKQLFLQLFEEGLSGYTYLE
ncbi:biosynthetic arginine decarboxylase [Marinospirillum alkaliphilum]|uniref:Biosynthetic arginine decarboxylase n=1 Tax=Marinospirillum alkaliphilum DSM 21637 TaxID=1122209 RepID=A0A1K1WNV8_9GAMM|nr:biosynthetic arginine decarboxylase [Marinospirillum alkaliphilum]SFX39080.1 arginine decarboxylase [Marinospirillum alkaliphilum DSM 21637]